MSVLYSLGIALRKLRKDLAHTVTMVATFSLGATAWTSATAVHDAWEPHPAGPALHVYRVELPKPEGELPSAPETARGEPLAFRDRVLLGSEVPARATDFFLSTGAARVAAEEPVAAVVAFSTREIGAIFGLTLAEGAFWSERADRAEERAVVLDVAAARALFGDRSPVGEEVFLYGDTFVVSGVLADPPGARRGERRPLVIAPSAFAEHYGVRPLVKRACDDPGTSANFFASDVAWLDLWVELDGEDARARFQGELSEYARVERARGRALEEPRLVSRMDVALAASVDPGTDLFALFATVLLGAVSLHLARFLDVKFRANRAETAIRRAFGASRRAIFLEHVLEAGLVGLASAVVLVPLTLAMLAILNRLITVRPTDYHLGLVRVAIGTGATVGIALLAGIVPALRASRAVAAEGLRRS